MGVQDGESAPFKNGSCSERGNCGGIGRSLAEAFNLIFLARKVKPEERGIQHILTYLAYHASCITIVAMAALRLPSPSFLAAFLPIARAQLLPQPQSITRRLPLFQRLRTSPLLPAALVSIPSLLADLWDGLLNAVPKKKTSHMKKRHRQLASGKHLKDVTALNRCSSCGRTKRAHVLCPYCVASMLL